ncbi:protein LEG1 homolog [Fukomys damarensis]|uniref:protein LEG1 homolog n=1 Tax=Fukomys damarensis TaxID=885580 RepID=UPI00053FB86E|nr:protein LEG1 homolog [Fukomys damarensis]
MALPPSWAWVLLGCASASLAGALSLSDLYPPLWQESPGQFSDYRVENGKYVIDPWVFTDRMGMYKVLLNRTATYFAKFGPENEQNLLWGLPLQHGWQYRSGRLADPSRQTDCGYKSNALCVSVSSWSADFNYFLSVLPFLAALDSGVMGTSPDKVTLLPPPKDQMRFCYNVSDCLASFPDLMNQWRIFYEVLCLNFNYFLSVLPFLAALDSGVMGTSPDKVTLLPPPKDQMRFCYNVSDCLASFPDLMNQWRIFYEVLCLSGGRKAFKFHNSPAMLLPVCCAPGKAWGPTSEDQFY